MALRVCIEPQCPKLSETTRCPAHRHLEGRSPSSRVTGTRRWREHTKPAVLRRDRYRCHWCGKRATTAKEKRAMTVDHLDPVSTSDGDPHDKARLVAACTNCNYSRRAGVGANPQATRPDAASPIARSVYGF